MRQTRARRRGRARGLRLGIGLGLGLAVVACGGGGTPAPDATAADAGEIVESTELTAVDSVSLASARGAADALGKGLMTALLGQLETGGPTAALAFCADSAQALTARYQADGMDVHRTSLKVRNPRNAPDSVEVRVLDRLAALHASGALPAESVEIRRLAAGARELRYFRPIRVLPGCVTCHGPVEGIAPEIRTVLAARYPDDAAVGYAMDDLRGVIAVRRTLPE